MSKLPVGTKVRGPFHRWKGTVVEDPHTALIGADIFVRLDWLEESHEFTDTIGRIAPCFEPDYVILSPLEQLAEQAE